MKAKFVAVAVALFFLLSASICFGEGAEKYYPLKVGMTWVYSVTSSKPGHKITVTNEAPRDLQGKTVTPRKWEVGGNVRHFFIGKDDYGVYRYAEQMSATAEPKVVTPKVYYLKNPVDKGTNWDNSIKMGENELKVNIIVESVRETVQVPAGTYKECVLLKHEGGMKDAKGHISITALEWYAPDVGLVKSMFTLKKQANGKEETETTTYQLESFK